MAEIVDDTRTVGINTSGEIPKPKDWTKIISPITIATGIAMILGSRR